ncbi:MAG TPA: prolipoprotein diacylglyceryl transferase [Actinomycetes bacterium]|nr:prolipoprotein diacylglyceryl transferase [Actinomycetes bacterium]
MEVVTPVSPLAYIPPPPTDGVRVGPLFFHFYGLAIAIGIVLAVALARRRWQAYGRDPTELERPAFWGIVAGFLGGRLAYVSTHLSAFADRPWAVLAIWEGGLALFGGLALGILTGALVARRRGLPVLLALDAAIPAIPLAQAFGRWGNYFNQELFGTPTTLPWALEVEPLHRPDRYIAFSTFHPTFLYESLYDLAIVGVLLWLDRWRRLRPGSLVLAYGALYGSGRFLLEQLRTDTTFRLFGLSRNAYVALAVVVACLVGLVLRERGGPPAEEEAGTGADADAEAGDGLGDRDDREAAGAPGARTGEEAETGVAARAGEPGDDGEAQAGAPAAGESGEVAGARARGAGGPGAADQAGDDGGGASRGGPRS